MVSVGQRVKNLLIAIDQLAWTIITLGGGYPDETISSACYRHEQQDYLWAIIARPIIDTIFFWDINHCMESYKSELRRSQSPANRHPEIHL